MLLALVFRGVAFEFRFQQPRIARFWAQRLLRRFGHRDVRPRARPRRFHPGLHRCRAATSLVSSWDWLTPFSVLTGIALIVGYGLLGAGWLIIKTEGGLQAWARRAGRFCLVGVARGDRRRQPVDAARRSRNRPTLVFAAQSVPARTGSYPDRGDRVAAWRALAGWGGDAAAFLAAMGLFLMSYLGIAISLWPMIVPGPLHPVAGSLRTRHTGLPVDRDAVPSAGHSHVHGVVILGVPRQGTRGCWIPIVPRNAERPVAFRAMLAQTPVHRSEAGSSKSHGIAQIRVSSKYKCHDAFVPKRSQILEGVADMLNQAFKLFRFGGLAHGTGGLRAMMAPGSRGIRPTWTSSAKDLVGTALGPSRLWVTVGYGIVNEVYYPRVDMPQVRDLGFIVADGTASGSRSSGTPITASQRPVPASRPSKFCTSTHASNSA